MKININEQVKKAKTQFCYFFVCCCDTVRLFLLCAQSAVGHLVCKHVLRGLFFFFFFFFKELRLYFLDAYLTFPPNQECCFNCSSLSFFPVTCKLSRHFDPREKSWS